MINALPDATSDPRIIASEGFPISRKPLAIVYLSDASLAVPRGPSAWTRMAGYVSVQLKEKSRVIKHINLPQPCLEVI